MELKWKDSWYAMVQDFNKNIYVNRRIPRVSEEDICWETKLTLDFEFAYEFSREIYRF